jgi:uncharacterized protein YdhG (YjbR/CyaY superfamily)
MTVSELRDWLAGANPDAEVCVSYEGIVRGFTIEVGDWFDRPHVFLNADE